MNTLIVVHDITEKNWHLMPWRTVVEVVNNQEAADNNIYLVSLGDKKGSIKRGVIPTDVLVINKSRNSLQDELTDLVSNLQIDTVFWPFTWREPRWRLKTVTGLSARVICWLPGGEYTVKNVLYAVKRLPIKLILPYLIDALYPKKLVVTFLKNRGVDAVLAMTHKTADVAINAGWPSNLAYSIPPGKDYIDENVELELDVMHGFSEWLKERKYYLFAGPPSGIRGVYELLESFDRLAERDTDICLVCLFRSDAILESVEIRNNIKAMKHTDRIYTVWDSVTKGQLNSFMSRCHAIVLPFVIVPSEIPLAIIEATRFGKPVIATAIGGTGKYVEEVGVSVELGSVDELAKAMLKLLQDNAHYRKLSTRVYEQYRNHITWKMMSDQWIDVAEDVTKNN